MKKKIFSLYLLSASILFAENCIEGNCSDDGYFEKLKSNISQVQDVYQNYEKYKSLEKEKKDLEQKFAQLRLQVEKLEKEKKDLEEQGNKLNNFSNKAFR